MRTGPMRTGPVRPAPPPRPGEEPLPEPARNLTAQSATLEQVFLEIVGTDRDGNLAAHAPEQELSWLS